MSAEGGHAVKRARVEEDVPVLSGPGAVYTTAAALKRYEAVVAKYTATFGSAPAFCARAPGRVNLIGEHIDYSGYGVLPMAIDQDVLVACGTNEDGKLNLVNLEDKYPDRTYPADSVEIDNSRHDWGNYFLCGYKGALEAGDVAKPVGLNVVLSGIVPSGSGLSSSSALVCCSALATGHANSVTKSKLEMATICARCERYVGTEGGGMDQSISFLAQEGTAKMIEFNPIRAADVQLPKGAVFVISNSLVEANKYVSAGSCYNKRVVECRLGAQVLGKVCGVGDLDAVRTLGVLQQKLGNSLPAMEALVTKHLDVEPYTKESLCTILGVTTQDLETKLLSPTTIDQTSFNLRERAIHVYSEAQRVFQYRDATSLEELGRLMNESHESCAKEFDCSCPELDELTALCRASGALGSRLTGAGWGGCAVSMVPSDKVPAFLEAVEKGYYAKDPANLAKLATSLFATAPGQGAAIIV